MPRGKKTSVTERNNWRRDYDESGKSLEDIAKEAGRAISTVSKCIERARAEEDIKKVRFQQLGDAYQLHTSDLLSTARVIQNSDSTKFIKRPETLGPLGHEMLLEGIKSHIPRSPLWRADRERQNQWLRMAGLRKGLDPATGAAVDEALGLCPLVLSQGFKHSLQYAVGEVLVGNSIELDRYKIEGGRKCWMQTQLSDKSNDDEALQTVEEIHRRILQDLVLKVPVTEYAEAKDEHDRAQRVIDQEVEMLTLRRIIPGECNLCPRY